MSKGNSRKYASCLGWRDLALLLGTMGEDHRVHLSFTVEPVGLVPFQVRITAHAYEQRDAFMQTLPVAVSRATVQSGHVEQLFAKIYWLAWDISHQLLNKEALQREDKEAVPLPKIG